VETNGISRKNRERLGIKVAERKRNMMIPEKTNWFREPDPKEKKKLPHNLKKRLLISQTELCVVENGKRERKGKYIDQKNRPSKIILNRERNSPD